MRRELPARLSLVPPSSEKPQLSPPNTKSGRPQSETATYCTRSAKRSPSADILHCICKPEQRKTRTTHRLEGGLVRPKPAPRIGGSTLSPSFTAGLSEHQFAP